jgi:DnaJ-class molecular chaperone
MMSGTARDGEATDLPVLEVVCERCEGRGHSLRGRWDRCVPCDGAGYIPTPLGARILSLIAHQSRADEEA